VAAQLDVPYYVLDYVDEFRTEVVDRFGAEYMAGRTPNPCIECNRRVRFKALLDRTAALGCDVLVTGHHARIVHDDAGFHLMRAVDQTKDQSYVLHMLGQRELAQVRLPVGEMTKPEVRSHAARLGLRTADKPDSQDLCFVASGSYRTFLRDNFAEVAQPGQIVDEAGNVVGRHEGTVDFTIGQRKGLGVAAEAPRYVVDIEPATATVVIGRKEDLMVTGCVVADTTFVAGGPPSSEEIAVKVRYRAKAVGARLIPDDADRFLVEFADPQPGVAPGQAAVFYRGDEMLGGGTIIAAVR
jgi:tRNA-specific 2-thiouridylase